MPVNLPVFRTARCVFQGTASGVNFVNIFHVQGNPVAPLPFSQAEIDALTNALQPIYSTRFVSQLSSTYTASVLTCTDLSTDTGVVGTKTFATAGGVAGVAMSNHSAACVTWKINRHYRGGHPRTYLGPIAQSSVTNGTTFTSPFVTLIQTAANGFLTDVNALGVTGGPWSLVTVHRHRNNAPLTPPGLSFITSAVVDTRIDSQRRRLGKDR